MVVSTVRVLYFLPDDGDTEDCPNSFELALKPNETNLNLAVLRQRFPLPGVYHFRLKKSFNGQVVWEDLVDDSQTISTRSGIIVLKISRIKLLSRVNRSPPPSPPLLSSKSSYIAKKKNNPKNLNPSNSISNSNDLLGFDFNQASSDNLNLYVSPKSGSSSFSASPNLSNGKTAAGGYLDSLDWAGLDLNSLNSINSEGSTTDSNSHSMSNSINNSKISSGLSNGHSRKAQSEAEGEHKPITSPSSQANWQRFMDEGRSLQSLAKDFEIC